VCAIWFLFAWLGGIWAGRLRLSGLARIEHLLIAAGLGAGTTSLALLGLGVAGLWHPKLLCAIFYASLGIGIGSILLNAWRRRRPDGKERPRPHDIPLPQEHPGILQGAALVLILLAVIMNILATAAPATFFDALVYHLALPKLYLLHGRIMPTPMNLYSGSPFGIEMLYGLALAVGDENLACLLYCSFGILTALAIWALLRRYASSAAGVLAALLFYLSPVTLYAGWWCGSDLGGAFYLMLALMVVAAKLPGQDDRALASPIAAGILLGSAAAVKYTIAPMLAVFALVYFWLRRRVDRAGAFEETACMIVVALAMFAPWLIKNIAFYGNPCYPFLHQLLGWAAPGDWRGFLADAHAQDWAQTFGSAAGWRSFLMHPWFISMSDSDIEDWLGLSFLMFIPWALRLRWGVLKEDAGVPAASTAIGLLSLAGYLVWALSSGLVRFMLPTLPFISCLAALAIARKPVPAWLRRAGWTAAIFSSTLNLQMTFQMGSAHASALWPLLLGHASRSDYLKAEHMGYGAPYYAAMEYINQHLPPDAKVLFLGDSRGYYCERDFIAPTVFDRHPFWDAAKDARSAEELLDQVKRLGITHIFVSANELYGNAGRPTVMPKDIIAGKVFGDFWDRCLEKVFEDRQRSKDGATTNWLIVYRLLDKPGNYLPGPSENPPRIILESARRQART